MKEIGTVHGSIGSEGTALNRVDTRLCREGLGTGVGDGISIQGCVHSKTYNGLVDYRF